MIRQTGGDRAQLRNVGVLDPECVHLDLRAERVAAPGEVPTKRQDIEGAFHRRRADVGLAVGQNEHCLLGVRTRVDQDPVGLAQGVVGRRVSEGDFSLDPVAETSVQRTFSLGMRPIADLEVVHVDAGRCAECDDGDAGVVPVDGEVFQNLADELEHRQPAGQRDASGSVKDEDEVDLFGGVVSGVELLEQDVTLLQQATVRRHVRERGDR